MAPFVWLLAALATYRLTLLVTNDEITATPRDALLCRLKRPAHRPARIDYEFADGILRAGRERDAQGRRWLKVRCTCGETVAHGDVRQVRGLGSVVVDAYADRSAVLSAYNGHRNEHAGEEAHPKLAVLVTCPWCVSVWVSVPVVASALAWADGWGWQLAAGTLAAAALTGALAERAAP